ncbi:MAG TPA: hypothetical protein VLK33_04740, partial [Terriglobales bacterium]|nr:hypothetical protein [Terriglobales bacterium]
IANPLAVSEEGDIEWTKEKKSRTILCEEIQGCIIEKYPGQSAEDKKSKAGVMAQYFGTRSWTAIESMNSYQLREGLEKLRQGLGLSDTPPPPAKSAGDDGDLAPQAPKMTQDVLGGVNTPPGTQSPQEPINPAQSGPKESGLTPLAKVQALIAGFKPRITSEILLQVLRQTGYIKPSVQTLEEVAVTKPETLVMVVDNWETFHKASIELATK